MKKTIIPAALAAVVLPAAAMAQTAAPAEPAHQVSSWFFEPLFYLALLVGIIVALTFYALFRAVKALTHRLAPPPAAPEITPSPEQSGPAKPTVWHRIMDGLTRSVPVTQEKDILLDHNYDGIRELDNQLPPWWKWGFYLTIIFAAVYMLYYHVSGDGNVMAAEYKDELAKAAMDKEARMRDAKNNVTEDNVAVLVTAEELAAGKAIFTGNCVTCHGTSAQGTPIAPNLTDEYWLHGGGIRNVFHTITNGVPGKAMISWSQKLSPRQINEVASFVLSLQGSHPAGAKQPEGDLFQDAGAPSPSANTKKN